MPHPLARVSLPGPTQSTARPMIAIVDDEAAVRRALRRILRLSGFEVTEFADAAAFLPYALAGAWSCVLMNVHMVGIDGLKALALLRGRGTAPVVTLSGDVAPEIARRALALGAVAHLSKPVDECELVATLLRAIAAQGEELAMTPPPRHTSPS